MTTPSEIKFESRKLALQQKFKDKRILSFFTPYRPRVPNLKQILQQKWHLIKQQPLPGEIFKDPSIVSYKRGTFLSTVPILVRVKLKDQWVLHELDWSCVDLLPHYHPCLPKAFESLFPGGTFAAKVIFVVENTQDSFHLLL